MTTDHPYVQELVDGGQIMLEEARFIEDEKTVGNAEQFASTMALRARGLDLPARVAMWFRVDAESTEVLGLDAHAWVEEGFENGWKRFDPTSDRRETPQNASTRPKPLFESQDAPPPPVIPPESIVSARLGEQAKRGEARDEATLDDEGSGGLGGILVVGALASLPFTIAGGFAGFVLVAKGRRRNRRRSADDPANRIAGGWDEYVDHPRDIGLTVWPLVPRREKAMLIASEQSMSLAAKADGALFGRGDPADEQIEAYWTAVDDATTKMRGELSWLERLRATLS